VGVATLAAASVSQATVVTAASHDFTVIFANNLPDLKATLQFSDFVFSGNTFTTTVTITNLTSPAIANVRVTGFGFNTNPDAVDATDSSSEWNTAFSAEFAGFETVDICLRAGAACAVGSTGGLLPGQSTSFELALTLASPINQIDLGADNPADAETFYVIFQTDRAAYEFMQDDIQIPEPLSAAFLGTGFLGLGMIHRRKSS